MVYLPFDTDFLFHFCFFSFVHSFCSSIFLFPSTNLLPFFFFLPFFLTFLLFFIHLSTCIFPSLLQNPLLQEHWFDFLVTPLSADKHRINFAMSRLQSDAQAIVSAPSLGRFWRFILLPTKISAPLACSAILVLPPAVGDWNHSIWIPGSS